MGASHVRRRARQHQLARITADDRLYEIDLLQGLDHLLLLRQLRRHPHRPELTAHAAAAQASQIGVVARLAPGEVAQVERPARVALVLAQCLGPVVVPVDQRRCAQDVSNPRLLVLRGGWHCGGGGEQRQKRPDQRRPRAVLPRGGGVSSLAAVACCRCWSCSVSIDSMSASSALDMTPRTSASSHPSAAR